MIATSFWEILFWVCVGLGWLFAVMALAVISAEHDLVWVKIICGVSAFLLFASGVALAINESIKEENSNRRNCEIQGGSWQKTGTTPIMAGKTIIYVNTYGCVRSG